MSLPIATRTYVAKPRFDNLGLGETVYNFHTDGDEEMSTHDRRMGAFHVLREMKPCSECGGNRADVAGLSEPGVVSVTCAACDRLVYEG